MRLLALLMAAACAAAAQPAAKEKPVMQWQGAQSGVETSQDFVITKPRKWKELWAMIGQAAPAIDFKEHVAIAVFLGERMTAGYEVVFDAPVLVEKSRVVRYYEKTPQNVFTAQVITRPWAVRLLPKKGGPVSLEYDPR